MNFGIFLVLSDPSDTPFSSIVFIYTIFIAGNIRVGLLCYLLFRSSSFGVEVSDCPIDGFQRSWSW